jgi:subtilisin-like proprotein convertase family protein
MVVKTKLWLWLLAGGILAVGIFWQVRVKAEKATTTAAKHQAKENELAEDLSAKQASQGMAENATPADAKGTVFGAQYQPPSPTSWQVLNRPGPGDSLEKILQYKRGLEAGQRPKDDDTSLRQPGTAPFDLIVGGETRRYHAALNEIFVQKPDGTAEIVEISAAPDLQAWQKEAQEVDPKAELVLYPPDQPREESQALILGSTLIVEAENEAQATALAAEEGWEYLQPVGGENSLGRYLVANSNPVVNLQALLAQKLRKGGVVTGNFRKVLFPRQKAPSRVNPARARALAGRFVPNDTNFPSQWHLWQTNAVGTGNTSGIDVNVIDAWDLYKGAGVIVGIVDDGLQLTHPDLSPNIATNALIHRDWNDSTPNDPSPTSLNAHGTAVGGLVGARGNNTIGVSGVAPEAKLAGLRLTAGVPTDADEADAFGWKNSLISVKNNSWGPSDDGTTIYKLPTTVAAALASATSTGRGGLGEVFVWANGNGGSFTAAQFVTDSSNYDGYANSIHVISVAALAANGRASYYSEKGGNVSVTAPSSGPSAGTFETTPAITTTDLAGTAGYSPTDYTSSFGGTSAATPMVSGIVALMLQANPLLGWRDVKEILLRTARQVDTGESGWVSNKAGLKFNPWYGAGLVDATEAVNLALNWENLEPMQSASATSAALNIIIPDNKPEGITVDLPISQNFRVESVAVTVSATHLYRGDLVFTVISPGGTQARLTGGVRYRDSNSNLTDVTFTTPFLWGESSAGTWQVKAADEWVGVTGRLTKAAITVYGSASPVAPGNDNFDRAFLLDGTSTSISTSNRGAGREKGEVKHAGQQGGGSLWWKIQPRTSGYLTIDTLGSSIDTLVALYEGTGLDALTEVAANDDISSTVKQSRISRFAIEPGNQYMLAVDGKNRVRGSVQLNLNLEAGALYDRFTDAKPVTGNSWTETRSNAAYSAEAGEPAHAGTGAAARSVWYRWTPTVSGTATVDTRGSTLDTRLGVYLGTAVNRLNLVAANDNDAGRSSSRVQFGVRAGQSYCIAVDGKNGASGNFTITGVLGSNSVAPAPTNDVFATPIAISGAPLNLRASNVNATRQTGEPAGTTSVWYQWTAPKSGVVTVTTEGSLIDTTLGAYSGSSVASVVAIPSYPDATLPAYNDNAVSGQRWSRIRFQTGAGGRYYLRVDGVRGATGRYDLKISY